MKVFCVRIPIIELSNSRGLELTRPLNDRPAKETFFELRSDVKFYIG
jgi:hypothetical protein